MKVKVHVSTGAVWEEVEVEVNEINPRIAIVMALHDAGPIMQRKVGVDPMTVVDRMMGRFGATIHALRDSIKNKEVEDDSDSTTD